MPPWRPALKVEVGTMGAAWWALCGVIGQLVLGACSAPPAQRPGMAYVPAGEFHMGRDRPPADRFPWEEREEPAHLVYLHAFYIDCYEVTNAQFEKFSPRHRRSPYSPCDECPVTEVSWYEARAYCRAQRPPKRLPTEAEWEKAAKGGVDREPTPLGDYAWYAANSIKRAQPVGRKLPNGYGLYDMLGNVREWTADWFDPEYYRRRVYDNPKGPVTGRRRVERGGAFFLPARGVTTTIRYNHPPQFRLYFLGFRCAQDP